MIKLRKGFTKLMISVPLRKKFFSDRSITHMEIFNRGAGSSKGRNKGVDHGTDRQPQPAPHQTDNGPQTNGKTIQKTSHKGTHHDTQTHATAIYDNVNLLNVVAIIKLDIGGKHVTQMAPWNW